MVGSLTTGLFTGSGTYKEGCWWDHVLIFVNILCIKLELACIEDLFREKFVAHNYSGLKGYDLEM